MAVTRKLWKPLCPYLAAGEPEGASAAFLTGKGQRNPMTNHSLLYAATALVLTSGVTSAQNQRSQDKTEAPTALQSTTPDKPPIANVPKAATDVAGVPRRQTMGQAPKGRGWALRWIARATSEPCQTKSCNTSPPGLPAAPDANRMVVASLERQQLKRSSVTN